MNLLHVLTTKKHFLRAVTVELNILQLVRAMSTDETACLIDSPWHCVLRFKCINPSVIQSNKTQQAKRPFCSFRIQIHNQVSELPKAELPHFLSCLSHRLISKLLQLGLQLMLCQCSYTSLIPQSLIEFPIPSRLSFHFSLRVPTIYNMADAAKCHVETVQDLGSYLKSNNATVQKFFSDRESLINEEKSRRSGI
jgi:hypothetical protein